MGRLLQPQSYRRHTLVYVSLLDVMMSHSMVDAGGLTIANV